MPTTSIDTTDETLEPVLIEPGLGSPPMSDAFPAREPEPVPISVSLLSRRSVTGAIVVLAVALFYTLGVPALNGLVKGENPFEPGEPYVVAGSYRITPAEGWGLNISNDLFTAIEKSGAQLVLTIAVEAEQTPDEIIQSTIDALTNDPEQTWVVGSPRDFATDVGDQGLEVVANGSDSARLAWVVSNSGMSITAVGDVPGAVWGSVNDEMEAMVRSIVFETGEDVP